MVERAVSRCHARGRSNAHSPQNMNKMRKIFILAIVVVTTACQNDYSRAALDVYGNGTIDYERCSIVITTNAIIIKKDTIVQNSNGSHWVPSVRVILRNPKNVIGDKQIDSLMESTGFKKTH